jgi:hypothetical protein
MNSFWVVAHRQAFEYRPRINYGGRALFFRFSGELSTAPEVEWIELTVSPNPTGPIIHEYIQYMKDVVREGAEVFGDSGGRLCSVRLTVSGMVEHPVDTFEYAVRLHCRRFVGELARGAYTRQLSTFDRRWASEAVTGLATGIRSDGAFDRLPLLADALEDAGCDDRLLLAHCRGCLDHAPRCWAVDWILVESQPGSLT